MMIENALALKGGLIVKKDRRAKRTIAEQRAEHEARIEALQEKLRTAQLAYAAWESALRAKHEAALAELTRKSDNDDTL